MSRLKKNLSVLVVALALAAAYSKRGDQPPSVDPPVVPGERIVLILEESETSPFLPEGQRDILAGQQWRRDWTAAGGDIRVLDPIGDDSQWRDFSMLEQKWQKAISSVKEIPLPSCVVGGYAGPLPQTIEEWEKLLAKYRDP